jgi:hypothetical protein
MVPGGLEQNTKKCISYSLVNFLGKHNTQEKYANFLGIHNQKVCYFEWHICIKKLQSSVGQTYRFKKT